jgi:23S rRNA (cytosine1962-C5)-methyltransferase
MEFAEITLKKGKEASPLRKHHWIFSGAIAKQDEHLKDGDPVEVFDFQKNKIATGYFNQGSIAVKILAFGNETVDEKFFLEKFKTALAIREKAGLLNNPQTNAYRLIHAEGDGLPGIVIDYYNGHVVVQIHHVYMMSQVELISKVLRQLLPDIQTIYLKFTTKFRSEIDPYIFGNTPQTIIKENGISFEVNWEKGQKTGFFLDQRDNRFLLSKYAPHRNMLNTFCYTGGFSIYALANQVNSVTSVDSSAHAMEGLEKNIVLNNLSNQTHHSLTQDALEYLTKTEEAFDLIVLDPPAFAKSMSARHNAIMAYKRINALALKKITEGGILFTYSCSQVVDRSAFVGAVLSAAIETKREVKILHQLSQPADHPVNIFHPETEYLKGLVLFVK